MASIGFAILSAHILPKWIGWLSLFSFLTCIIAIPAVYAGRADNYGFYNVAGWGPTIVTNILSLVWILAASITMIRKSNKG